MKIELISKYFEQDHDRLDNLFQEYTRLKNDDFPRAKESFLQFELGLRRHIVWEEDILFPLFEKKTGMFEHGPTSVMKLEHREIHGILDAMRQKIMNGQSGTGKEEEQLLLTLGNHNLKEESVLYPMLDEHVSEAERRGVFQEMEAMTESRYRQNYIHA